MTVFKFRRSSIHRSPEEGLQICRRPKEGLQIYKIPKEGLEIYRKTKESHQASRRIETVFRLIKGLKRLSGVLNT